MNKMVNAGLDVRVQPFTANLFEENSPPRLVKLQPNRQTYEANVDFATMTYSGADDVSTPLALARGIIIPPSDTVSSQSGCDPNHFRSNVAGKVVLIQRGTCTSSRRRGTPEGPARSARSSSTRASPDGRSY